MNVRTKHWTLKPHRNMRQHKVFLRHELLKYNSEKSTAKSSALENYISSANLSLSGCSSAEPDSVSVGACKFQMKKLYLQTVKKVDHLPIHFSNDIVSIDPTQSLLLASGNFLTTEIVGANSYSCLLFFFSQKNINDFLL